MGNTYNGTPEELQRDGLNIRYFSAEQQNSIILANMAITQNVNAYQYISKQLQTNYTIIKLAYEKDNNAYYYFPPEIKTVINLTQKQNNMNMNEAINKLTDDFKIYEKIKNTIPNDCTWNDCSDEEKIRQYLNSADMYKREATYYKNLSKTLTVALIALGIAYPIITLSVAAIIIFATPLIGAGLSAAGITAALASLGGTMLGGIFAVSGISIGIGAILSTMISAITGFFADKTNNLLSPDEDNTKTIDIMKIFTEKQNNLSKLSAEHKELKEKYDSIEKQLLDWQAEYIENLNNDKDDKNIVELNVLSTNIKTNSISMLETRLKLLKENTTIKKKI